MLLEYISLAMQRARYSIIKDKQPFYGEIPDLKGVWANGKTLEECRATLQEVLEGWIMVRLQRGLNIPSLGELVLQPLVKTHAHAKASSRIMVHCCATPSCVRI